MLHAEQYSSMILQPGEYGPPPVAKRQTPHPGHYNTAGLAGVKPYALRSTEQLSGEFGPVCSGTALATHTLCTTLHTKVKPAHGAVWTFIYPGYATGVAAVHLLGV